MRAFNPQVVLFLLGWSCARGSGELHTEVLLDQLAVADENAPAISKPSESTSASNLPKNAASQLVTAIYYENSNGFVPMTPATTPIYHEKANDNKKNSISENGNIENDPVYSTEARIFLNLQQTGKNRRSFDSRDDQNDLEILKVSNDTPAVANYNSNYDNNSGDDGDKERDNSYTRRYKSRDRGKKLENYMRTYGSANDESNGESSAYRSRYYTYGVEKERQKTAYEQEKVDGNYHPQATMKYDGHGQSTIRQNAPATLPRTNYEANELSAGGASSATSTSQMRQTFSQPIAIVKPSNYKTDVQYDGHSSKTMVSSSTPMKTTSMADSMGAESQKRYPAYTRQETTSSSRSYKLGDDSRDLSDDSLDYQDYTQKPRRLHKSRRRPFQSEARRLPKEHRESYEDDYNAEEQRNKHHYTRGKMHRHKTAKVNPWREEDQNQSNESVEDDRNDKRTKQSGQRMKTDVWSQVAPNVEISHSSGVELGQVVPLNVNLLPVTNFDHATALGSSQGFDISNAVHGFVTASPIGAVSTTAAYLSTPQAHLTHIGNNIEPKHLQNVGFSTSVPDIIVGQNSYQHPLQAVLLSQTGGHDKNMGAQYLASTLAPIIVTQEPVVQSTTPRPTYAANPVSNQMIVPQTTLQTFSNLLPNSQYNIQVNPHGLQGQNLISNNQLQVIPTPSTTPQSQAVTRSILDAAESQNKKSTAINSRGSYATSNGETQNVHKQSSGDSSNYVQNQYSKQPLQQNTYIQATPIVPAIPIVHAVPTAIANLQNQQYINTIFKNARLPGLTLQAIDNIGSHSINTVNALNGFSGAQGFIQTQLPAVGIKNVQVLNPNYQIKPSPIDTTGYASYGTQVLTTPVPIFSAPSAFVTAKSVLASPTPSVAPNLQNYLHALTEIGSKGQAQDKPVFNPINFVPNLDLVKSQQILNSKLNNNANDQLQQNLNLVPVVPNGNFFKPSYAAQHELASKPKLTSDLEKYAEEMFKESLKTIYSSHKWNNDRRNHGYNQSSPLDINDLAKLRFELQKLASAMPDYKSGKDIEGHYSEHKFRTTEPKGSRNKKHDPLLETLEELLKAHPSESIRIYHNGKHSYDIKSPYTDHDGKDNEHTSEHFIPPIKNSYGPKSPFQDKPVKKRPGPHRHHSHNHPPRNHSPDGHAHHHNGHAHYHGSHSHPRPQHAHPHPPHHHHHHHHRHHPSHSHGHHHEGHSHRSPQRPRPDGHDSSASSYEEIHIDRPRHRPRERRPPVYDADNREFNFASSERGKQHLSSDSYHKLTTTDPEKEKPVFDFNHPRMHNLLGLLMKNKQLPIRSSENQNSFRDKGEIVQFFENEKARMNQQIYNEALRNYMLKKSDGPAASESKPKNMGPGRIYSITQTIA
ncbi:uncharacterized protein [Prorops nasuta]|uniref:uncharacterized protein n=1 Tax=Prorops nasuta TaxID=863751 RepID=UPI0034D00E8B